jgi:septal ring factor EnvC (AmiA/AmiB activator)
MTSSTSSTTQPFSSATSSSTAAQPQQSIPQYVVPVQPQAQSNDDSRFNISDWTIMAVGMVLTGIIGYFSSIMAVKSDIAENRKEISVVTQDVSHVQQDLSRIETDVKDIESDLKQVNELEKNTAILSVRLSNIEKDVMKNSKLANNNKGITRN